MKCLSSLLSIEISILLLLQLTRGHQDSIKPNSLRKLFRKTRASTNFGELFAENLLKHQAHKKQIDVAKTDPVLPNSWGANPTDFKKINPTEPISVPIHFDSRKEKTVRKPSPSLEARVITNAPPTMTLSKTTITTRLSTAFSTTTTTTPSTNTSSTTSITTTSTKGHLKANRVRTTAKNRFKENKRHPTKTITKKSFKKDTKSLSRYQSEEANSKKAEKHQLEEQAIQNPEKHLEETAYKSKSPTKRRLGATAISNLEKHKLENTSIKSSEKGQFGATAMKSPGKHQLEAIAIKSQEKPPLEAPAIENLENLEATSIKSPENRELEEPAVDKHPENSELEEPVDKSPENSELEEPGMESPEKLEATATKSSENRQLDVAAIKTPEKRQLGETANKSPYKAAASKLFKIVAKIPTAFTAEKTSTVLKNYPTEETNDQNPNKLLGRISDDDPSPQKVRRLQGSIAAIDSTDMDYYEFDSPATLTKNGILSAQKQKDLQLEGYEIYDMPNQPSLIIKNGEDEIGRRIGKKKKIVHQDLAIYVVVLSTAVPLIVCIFITGGFYVLCKLNKPPDGIYVRGNQVGPMGDTQNRNSTSSEENEKYDPEENNNNN